MFFIDIFKNNLKTQLLGKHTVYFDSTESTNKDIWTLFKKKAEEGLLVIANNQTNGRGRGNHIWHSNKGADIICSFLIKEENNYGNIGFYSLLTPVGIIEGIKKTININLKIKWPNDLIYKNKKIGGILIESKIKDNFIYLNIGFGINVNSDINDFPSTIRKNLNSLKTIYNHDIQREILLANIFNSIEQLLNNKETVINKWTKFCNHINQDIIVNYNNQLVRGTFKKINNYGQAIVNYNNNNIIINSPF